MKFLNDWCKIMNIDGVDVLFIMCDADIDGKAFIKCFVKQSNGFICNNKSSLLKKEELQLLFCDYNFLTKFAKRIIDIL